MLEKRRHVAPVVAALASASLFLLAAPAGAQTVGGAATATTPIITNAYGNAQGQSGFSGDGGPATAAKLSYPTGVSKDLVGNLYIGDTGNNRIRKVTGPNTATGGIISTVAGNGSFGFGGDGGLAKNAKLAAPTGTAVDNFGNLYIADTVNNRVRKVNTAGIITTFAGNGTCRSGWDTATASNANLCLPTGLALDSAGNLYVADSGNNRIRKVTPAGMVTPFAGTGQNGSSGDGGPATSAKLSYPIGLAVDSAMDVFIADTGNNKVREVTGGIIKTFAGNGTAGFSGDGNKATLAQLRSPTGLGVDTLGNVYISDTGNQRIRVCIPKGDIETYAGTGVKGNSGDNGPALNAQLNSPTGAVVADAMDVYFSDTGNHRGRHIHGGPPPNIPETPFNLALLPLSAIVLGGLGYLIMQRRRSHHVVL